MKRKLLFAAIMAVMGVGQSFAQYSTDDLVSAGWEAVNGTTVTLTDLDNYYYLLVDGTETNKSLTYSGVGTDARPVYQLLYDPTISVGQVWKLEASNGKFKLKSYANDWYYCSNSWGWNSYMGTNESYTEHEFVLADGKYKIHVKDEGGTTRALGAWGNYDLNGGGLGYAGTAGNKDVDGTNDRGFYIYRLLRTAFTPAAKPSANYAAAGWMEVTEKADWGVAGRKYVFLDISETGFETEMVMTATENGLPQYQRSNMSKAQWWTTEAKNSDGFAFKSVEYGTYSNYTAPWGGNMSATVPDNYFKPSLANGKWALKNTSDNGNSLGRWGDSNDGKNAKNDPFAGEQLAANKGDNNGRRLFNVYAIPTAIDAAEALPANGDMAANKWYYFDIAVAGNAYAAKAMTLADIECIEYSTSNTVTLAATANSLAATRYYVKSATANNLKVAATSYSYTIGAATANPADGAVIKPGQTITVTFTAQTDDPSATTTVDFSGVTFGGSAVAVTTSGTSFAFTVPTTVTAATSYTLSIPAGAVQYAGKASSAAAEFTYSTAPIFDGVYYLRNTDPNYEYKYIARGGKWATRAYVEDYGLAINLTLSDGKYALQLFDSEQWLGDDGEVYTDCTGNRVRYFTAEKVSGGYKFKRDGDYYLAVWTNDKGEDIVVADAKEGGNLVGATNVWALETPAEYAATCYARNAQKQVVAAATAAGLTGITTSAQLEAAFPSYKVITIPNVARQSQRNKHAEESEAGKAYTFFEETVTGLADGVYKLSFKGMQRAASYARVDAAEGARGLIYAYANDAKTQLVSVMEEGADNAYADSDYESARTGKHYPNSSTSTYVAFDEGLYNNEIYVYVTGGTLNFGMKTPSRCPNNDQSWTVFGDFELTYFFDLSTLVAAYETALANAKTTAAKTDKMAASVRTALENTINAYDGKVDESSQDALETAIDALTAAKEKAETSIVSYAIIATGSLPNNSTEGWAKTNNGDLKINTWSNESNNDGGSGFDQPFIENWRWNGDGALGAGKLYYRLEGLEPGETYYVEMNARTRNEANNNAPVDPVFYVNTTTIDFTTVATLNQDKAIYYGIVGASATIGDDGVLEFGLVNTDACNYNWNAVKDVKFGEAAVAADYTALSDAITAAEAKTLGFEANEYAPYNNVAALEALAAAKAIDPTAGNLKSDVQAATTALTGATWTANTAEVSAINLFATYDATNVDGSNRIYAPGWGKAGGTDAYNTRFQQGASGNAGMAAVDNELALFTKFSTTYGEEDGYTMPLKANTVYKLSFKYGAWGENKEIVSHLAIADGNGTAVTISPASFTRANNSGLANESTTAWFDYTGYFKTGDAGDYVLSLTKDNNGEQRQIVMGNIELKKAVAEDITIDENDDYTPEFKFANVELIRNIKANTWNTFVVPFDITNDELKDIFGDYVAVAEFSESSTDPNAVTVNFITMATPAITANTPVLLKLSNTGNTFEFDNKLIKTGEAKVAGTNVDFVGTYAPITVKADDYFISADKLYKSTGRTTIKGTRAYIDAKNASNVKLFIDDFETGIESLTPDPSPVGEGSLFNIAGQRVNKAQKGIYIQNGKKVLVK